MKDLKLIAFDGEDLAVIAAHLQDGVVQVGDMAYLKRERRFVAILNRFDWADAIADPHRARKPYHRRRTALRFERVAMAQLQGVDLAKKRDVLALLTITFEPAGGEDPGGVVTLLFAGGSAIRLHVECLEAEMSDLGAAWRAKARPSHPTES